MTRFSLAFALFSVAAIVACNQSPLCPPVDAAVVAKPCPTTPPTPSPTPKPVPTATLITDACAGLARATCSEGGSTCVPTVTEAQQSALTALPLACWAVLAPGDKAAARACGGVKCP